MATVQPIHRISRCTGLALLCLLWVYSEDDLLFGARLAVLGWPVPLKRRQPPRTILSGKKHSYDYDLVIIGAGASGLFASGAASSLGSKTLLLDQAEDYVGGDCSNAACVPSKAMRSVAKLSNTRNETGKSSLSMARQHSIDTVSAVRKREDASEITDRNPNLDLVFVRDCRFLSPHELELNPRNASSVSWETSPTPKGTVTVTSKAFLIATGASPIVPRHLEIAAKQASVPIHTYRTVLQPPRSNEDSQSLDDSPDSIWNMMQTMDSSGKPAKKHIVIAGGGPTSCELSQTLARLGGPVLNITIVAPELLPNEDVTLRRAAMKVLTNDGIRLRLGSRVTNVIRDEDSVKYVVLDDGRLSVPVDALLLCLGRSPAGSLSALNLEAAGVRWNPDYGVEVHEASLRSKSAPHVYACGDCCDAVRDRRAAHAAWTGFHAARNTILPFWLRMGSKAVHPTVPGVTYTDPELASVGLSYTECVRRYGKDGFDCLYIPEEGMDRADMERLERAVIGFVELRATKIGGKVLGMTACGPAAAELSNEVGLVITSGLTVRDMALSIHSYPSHGYLLHRIALAMATSNVWGLLSACGPVGKVFGGVGRLSWRISSLFNPRKLTRRRTARRIREWEAEGAKTAILISDSDGLVQKGDMEAAQFLSYLEVYSDESLLHEIISSGAINGDHPSPSKALSRRSIENVARWAQSRPF